MTALALGCLLGALALAVRDLLGSRAFAAGETVESAGLLRRAVAGYERSRAGRRLGVRLWHAQVHLSPAAWRSAQLMAAIPLATVLVGLGLDPLPAVAGSSTVVRLGGALLLRVRRHASTVALDAATPVLARALATELAAWGSGGQAVAGAAARCSAGQRNPMASRVLQTAAARVVLGGDAASSLRRAMEDAVPQLHPTSVATRVVAVFALHRNDSAATAQALDRLAAAIENEAALRSDLRAAVAEVRMSAIAVPLLAAASLALLLATDPTALGAALSLPLLPILAIAVVVVAGVSTGVRRLVST